jgi:hypothetical protein
MYRAERIAELTGTFGVEERTTHRIPPRLQAASSFNARAIPFSSNVPELPSRIPDQIIDFYAFVFCQSGFLNLGLTFEQFLAVISVIKFPELRPTDR